MVSPTKLLSLLSIPAAVLAAPDALGINCRGSSLCVKANVLHAFQSLAPSLDQNRQYQNGEHIMCTFLDATNICMFFQGTGFGAPGRSVGPLIDALIAHGCDTCGSVPIFFPSGNNDPSSGILTVNVVGNAEGCNANNEVAIICK